MPDPARPDSARPDPHRLGRHDSWDGVRAVVAGFGVSGFAAADNLNHIGATVTALDESESGDKPDKAELLEVLGATVRLGPGSTATLPDDVDLVVTSPGWKPSAPLLAQARERGVPIWGEVELAWRLRDPHHDTPWLAVTGTNGKTTSAFLLQAVLEEAGLPCGLVGTVEVRVGGRAVPAAHTTPEPTELQGLLARMRDAGDRACAIEVSSHALAQRRVAGVRFAAALFTNLTRDHLDYHADVEEYYLAKRALFLRPEHEGPDPPGAANLDDPFGRRLAQEAGALGFAVEAPAEVRPVAARGLESGIVARIATPRGEVEVESRLRGRFNLANLTGVVAAGELLGLSHEAVAAGLGRVAGVPGRFEAIDAGQPFQVLVDYAHTPDSLENVLRAARELVSGGRLVVVFGCGGDRDRGKRPQMGAAAAALADLAVVTSDNPRGEDPEAIIAEILPGMEGGSAARLVEADRRAAIAAAIAGAERGDVVVIAGKGHEQGQERAGVVTPFDDRLVARELLAGAPA